MFPMLRTANDIDLELLRLPPTLDVRAPPGSLNRTTAPRCVYGMPLTDEWIEFRYQIDVVLVRQEGKELIDRVAFMGRLCRQRIADMRPIFGLNVTTSLVKANVSAGTVAILVIGRPNCKPTRAQMREARDVFMRWDFMELPGWFPDYRTLC